MAHPLGGASRFGCRSRYNTTRHESFCPGGLSSPQIPKLEATDSRTIQRIVRHSAISSRQKKCEAPSWEGAPVAQRQSVRALPDEPQKNQTGDSVSSSPQLLLASEDVRRELVRRGSVVPKCDDSRSQRGPLRRRCTALNMAPSLIVFVACSSGLEMARGPSMHVNAL